MASGAALMLAGGDIAAGECDMSSYSPKDYLAVVGRLEESLDKRYATHDNLVMTNRELRDLAIRVGKMDEKKVGDNELAPLYAYMNRPWWKRFLGVK